jgi:hypothetical protein
MHLRKPLALLVSAFTLAAVAQTPPKKTAIPLDRNTAVRAINTAVQPEPYLGLPSLRVTDTAPPSVTDGGRLVMLPAAAFQNGEFEVDVAGEPGPGANAGARGFVGIAFRVDGAAEHFEYFYVRPTNGRSGDQTRRNHSMQYAAHPDYPWHVLREKEPARYESYADMEPAKWIHIRAQVDGRTARFFVNGAEQPSLVVSDLKLGAGGGALGLWIGPGTIAHFANLNVTAAP